MCNKTWSGQKQWPLELPNNANGVLSYNKKIKDVEDKIPDHSVHITASEFSKFLVIYWTISLKKQI